MLRNMEKTDSSNTRLKSVARILACQVCAIALIFLVTGCVTTGSNNSNQVKKVVKQNCGPQSTISNASNAPDANSTEQSAPAANAPVVNGPADAVNPNNCLPKGVIEISENFGVDPEIRGEFNQAVNFMSQENYAEAIKLLKAVAGKTSKFSAPYINLGIAYSRTGDTEKAEENFKSALEINKLHPVAINELGLIYRKTGRYVEARKLYEDLLSMYPDFLPARKNLGVLCDIYIQDLNCALEQYEEYLKGIPEDEKVKIWVADVKSRM